MEAFENDDDFSHVTMSANMVDEIVKQTFCSPSRILRDFLLNFVA